MYICTYIRTLGQSYIVIGTNGRDALGIVGVFFFFRGKLSSVCADKEYYQIEYINLSLELLLIKICSFHSSVTQLTQQIKLRSIWPEQVTRILVSLSIALFQVNAA